MVKIGKITAAKEEVHGEFIGMIKLSPQGCRLLREHFHRAKKLFDGKPYQRASVFKKSYLTDLLQDMANLGVPIHCEIVGSAWKEIDTLEDYRNVVEQLQRKHQLSQRNAGPDSKEKEKS